MRILYVVSMPPRANAPGAIPLVVHAALSSLAERHAITLVTTAGAEPGEIEALAPLRQAGIEVQVVERSQPRGLAHWRRRWRWGSAWLAGGLPWRTIWFREEHLQQVLDRLAAERRFDLASVEDNAMGVYTYPRDLPAVFTEYEVRMPRPPNWHALRRRNPARWAYAELDWRRWTGYQRQVWGKFDLLQVFSRRDLDAMLRLAPKLADRVRVNPFGIVIPPEGDPDMEQPGRLLFVGNYTHPPNIDAAVWLVEEILPAVRKRFPQVHLDLVGVHPPREVRDLAGNGVAVVGPAPQIEAYLRTAAVVVAPVRIGGGMRMKVLQALAFGKAVVTTPRGADGLEFPGVAIPALVAEDENDFARAICELLENQEVRRALGSRARAFIADHFSAQAYGKRLDAVYEEAVAGRSPGRHGRVIAEHAAIEPAEYTAPG